MGQVTGLILHFAEALERNLHLMAQSVQKQGAGLMTHLAEENEKTSCLTVEVATVTLRPTQHYD